MTTYLFRYDKNLIVLSLFVVLSAILLIPVARTGAEEKILSFHSDITVHPDASLTVTETIRVRAENDKIKRGIYRDFPTRYRGKFGLTRLVGFKVLQIMRDGKPEPYHFEAVQNGKRIYIGQENYILTPGEYTYMLVYKTDHQLGFFTDFDELYWNVTGNNWEFVIEKASATVHLPGDAGKNIISTAGYTGIKGEKGKNFRKEMDAYKGTISFFTTKPLSVYEGLTIALSWPKGYVTAPESQASIWHLIADNKGFVFAILGIFFLLGYYLIVWAKVGKDPEKGVIVTHYGPPENLSPAVTRFIMKMGYDDKAFTAAIINLAVKGYLTIKEEDGEYSVVHRSGDKRMEASSDEEKVYSRLFAQRKEVLFNRVNHAAISSAVSGLKRHLEYRYERIYFAKNHWYFIIGLMITIAVMIVSGISESFARGTSPLFLFISIWLTLWSAGVFFLLVVVIKFWKEVFSGSGKIGGVIKALFLTCFSIPFFGGELAGLYVMAFQATSVPTTVSFIISIIISIIFYSLLKAPTRAGRKILDVIEGFRTFLNATEKDRLNFMNPPDRTPQLFEKFLPYALALDVEQQWAEQFSDVISAASGAGTTTSAPIWYSGTSLGAFSAASFASSLSTSLSSAISSSTASSSSGSGSSGGGSSGGGGGGGGGGGW